MELFEIKELEWEMQSDDMRFDGNVLRATGFAQEDFIIDVLSDDLFLEDGVGDLHTISEHDCYDDAEDAAQAYFKNKLMKYLNVRSESDG